MIDSAFITLIIIVSFIALLSLFSMDKKSYFYIIFFVLFIFTAIKDPFCFRDMKAYEYIFNQCLSDRVVLSENVNIGYLFLCKFIRLFTDNFVIFLAILTYVNFYISIWFIKKYSNNLVLSAYLFMPVLYFYCFSPLRQTIAMSICLFAYNYIVERKLFNFFLVSLLAILMHSTAFIIVPFYFIYGMNTNKKNIILLFIGSIIAIISLQTVGTYLSQFQSWYSGYTSSKYSASTIRILQKSSFLLLYVYALKKEVFNKNINFLLLLFSIAEVILYLGSSGIDGVYRLRWYFDYCEIIGLPIIVKEFHSKNKILMILIVLYICSVLASCFQFLASENFEFGYRSIL